jgi:hypothetical protein
MPLSVEQRRRMDIYIRSNTIYDWQGVGNGSISNRSHIIDSIERALDANSSFTCDLFLPNCFINGHDNPIFWYNIAAIACANENMGSWHELEYGPPLNREDLRQKYVYTWTLLGDTYRFYTKKLNDGNYRELVWYINKSKGGVSHINDDIDSSNDTDTEDIMLRMHT